MKELADEVDAILDEVTPLQERVEARWNQTSSEKPKGAELLEQVTAIDESINGLQTASESLRKFKETEALHLGTDSKHRRERVDADRRESVGSST